MEKNRIKTSGQKVISRKSRSVSEAEHNPKKMNKDQSRSTRDLSQLMALQDALQDPVTNHEEGF